MKHQISVKMNILNPGVVPSLSIALALLCAPVPSHALDPQGRLIIGTDGGIWREVKTFDALALTERSSLTPDESTYRGGVRVATGDLDGDGTADIITGSGPGAAHVKAFSGKDGSLLHSIFPYGDNFSGGIFVATGDVNGDGLDDIVTGAASAGGHVKVFDGKTGAEIHSFFAFSPTFTGGVRVATGDVDGDGRADIITGSGPGSAQVKVFSGKSLAEIRSFAPYDPRFDGGVFVAAADLDGDRSADIVIGNDAGGSPQVKVFSGRTGGELQSFSPFPSTFSGGVRVATGDIDGDKVVDIIASGGLGSGSTKIFSGKTSQEIRALVPFGTPYSGGVFVAASDFDGDGLADVVTGADAGAVPHVKVFRALTGAEMNSFNAFPTSFSGGVRVATGDIDGDGTSDIITGSGPGASHVKAFSGRDGSTLHSFFAFDGFSGGVFVASGDVNGDGLDDIITGAGPGAGPHVKVFDGKTGVELHSFFAYSPNFNGGVSVATGDVDGDGRADIITGSGTGSTHVKVFSGKNQAEIRSFAAFDPQFSGGVFVGAGDVNGDGFADIIAGSGFESTSHVKVFDGRTGGLLHSFSPFPATFMGGVRVAAADLDGDGRHEIIVAPGAGIASQVRIFDGLTVEETGKFFAYDESFTEGVFIAADSWRRPVLETRFDSKANTLVVHWPAGTRCVLESNPDLADLRGWKPLEIRPVQNGNRLEVTVPTSLVQEFFRLNCSQ
jgi:hypothetical protein